MPKKRFKMVKSIAFHTLKGGVGKSTISGNIGYCISKQKKTVLIDCDMQANLSTWFLKESAQYELANVLQGEIEVRKAIIQVRDNLFIVPTKKRDSSLKLYGETKLFQEPFIFEDLNVELNKLGFEYAIYDLAPSMSQLERCVLLACNEVVTPITAEYFGFEGVELFYSELQKINRSYKRNIKHNKIIINIVNNSFDTHKQYSELLSNLESYEVYKIGQDRKIADSQKHNKTIFEYYPKSSSILELEKIATSLL